MEPLRHRRDVLAANLLFVTLFLTAARLTLFFVAASRHGNYPPAPSLPPGQAVVALAGLLVRAGLYYAIRQGWLAAKLLVALDFGVGVWSSTNLAYGLVAGVSFSQGALYALVAGLPALLDRLLTLAALGLLAWPVRAR